MSLLFGLRYTLVNAAKMPAPASPGDNLVASRGRPCAQTVAVDSDLVNLPPGTRAVGQGSRLRNGRVGGQSRIVQTFQVAASGVANLDGRAADLVPVVGGAGAAKAPACFVKDWM